jgi:hypothetical protein
LREIHPFPARHLSTITTKILKYLTFNVNDIKCYIFVKGTDNLKGKLRPHTFTFPLDFENKIIITRVYDENDKLVGFVINFISKIKEKWYDIYRVDTAHGFLHEQKFWKTKEPIPLPEFEKRSLYDVFDIFFERLKNNWRVCRELYIKNMNRR